MLSGASAEYGLVKRLGANADCVVAGPHALLPTLAKIGQVTSGQQAVVDLGPVVGGGVWAAGRTSVSVAYRPAMGAASTQYKWDDVAPPPPGR